MRTPISVRRQRRVLCVFPAYTPSFGTFQHAFALMGRVRAFMPPQGLLLIAAYMPAPSDQTWLQALLAMFGGALAAIFAARAFFV